jgi:iron complex outermembrane receptor protein
LLNDTRGRLDLRVWGDYVRGKLDDGEDLPRITPPRFGAGLDYQRGPWQSGINFMHVFDQDDVAPLETKTDGYTMFNVYADYALSWGSVQYTLFARGRNMLDEEARRATSFLKDRAPLPGASAVVGIRVTF